MRRILITGGAGFVGSNLALLLKKDYPEDEILCLDNLKRKGSELNVSRLKKAGIVFINGDVRIKKDLDLIEFDTLIECSAEPSILAGQNSSPEYAVDTNLVGTLNCLEAVRKRRANLIFLSTSRVYPIKALNEIKLIENETMFAPEKNQNLPGISETGISEDFPIRIGESRSLYGATKLASELIIKEYFEMCDLKGIINRCGVIAGPWQMGKIDQGIVSFWLSKYIFGGELSYIGFGGTGKQVRDILHINDLYALIKIQLLDMDKFNAQTFNVGGGIESSVSLNELTKLCEDITGVKLKISSIIQNRAMDIPYYVADNGKILNNSGWKPLKNPKEIIKDTFSWMIENKEILKDVFS